MELDELYPGLQVRVVDWGDHRPSHWSDEGDMDGYRGQIVTIAEVEDETENIYLHSDDDEYGWQFFAWDFEPYHPVPEDNPNTVYRRYKHDQRIAALRDKMQKKKIWQGTITGRIKS